jgi:hypothetical protein
LDFLLTFGHRAARIAGARLVSTMVSGREKTRGVGSMALRVLIEGTDAREVAGELVRAEGLHGSAEPPGGGERDKDWPATTQWTVDIGSSRGAGKTGNKSILRMFVRWRACGDGWSADRHRGPSPGYGSAMTWEKFREEQPDHRQRQRRRAHPHHLRPLTKISPPLPPLPAVRFRHQTAFPHVRDIKIDSLPVLPAPRLSPKDGRIVLPSTMIVRGYSGCRTVTGTN